MSKKKRFKHNYTTELEVKCLLIRVKNKKSNTGTEKYNNLINKYVKLHTLITDKKYPQELIHKKNTVRKKLKERAIELSEITIIDDISYEQFGNVIMLMISKILTKPNFSGYTYRDDFFSDAIHKIIKYLHNFDHTMISERSGQSVNAFAYISQIIHNSIVFIINTKNKEQSNIKNQVSIEIASHDLAVKDHNKHTQGTYYPDEHKELTVNDIYIDTVKRRLTDELDKIKTDGFDIINIHYPHDYRISMQEYDDLKPYLKGNINIFRRKKNDTVSK